MDALEQETCASCKYFADNGMYPRGECRRHAPVAFHPPNASYTNPEWPLLLCSEWCGDHAAAEIGKAKEG